MAKNPSANAGDADLILDWQDSLGKEVATHFGILDWEIPWTVEPVGLQSTGSRKSRT